MKENVLELILTIWWWQICSLTELMPVNFSFPMCLQRCSKSEEGMENSLLLSYFFVFALSKPISYITPNFKKSNQNIMYPNTYIKINPTKFLKTNSYFIPIPKSKKEWKKKKNLLVVVLSMSVSFSSLYCKVYFSSFSISGSQASMLRKLKRKRKESIRIGETKGALKVMVEDLGGTLLSISASLFLCLSFLLISLSPFSV